MGRPGELSVLIEAVVYADGSLTPEWSSIPGPKLCATPGRRSASVNELVHDLVHGDASASRSVAGGFVHAPGRYQQHLVLKPAAQLLLDRHDGSGYRRGCRGKGR